MKNNFTKKDEYGKDLCTVIYVDNTPDMVEHLEKSGYQRRTGDQSRSQNTIAIVLSKKYYWPCSRKCKKYTQTYI